MKNKQLFIIIICLTILISLAYKKFTMDQYKDDMISKKTMTLRDSLMVQDDLIIRQKQEISSLRKDMRFYADKLKTLTEENEMLSVQVDSLRSENYALKFKSRTHEKNPIISDSKSAYYTKFLSNRYSK